MKITNIQVKESMVGVTSGLKLTGERAKIDAKVNNTYIVYATKNGLVKELPNGEVKPYISEEQGKFDDLS